MYRKYIKWVVSVLLLFCLFFLLKGNAIAATGNDLADFLTNIQIDALTDEHGHYLIDPNNPYEITLHFAENETLQFDDFNELFYDFPNGMAVGNFGSTAFDIEVTDESGTITVTGNTFEVANNRLLVKFNSNHPDFSRLIAASNAEFSINISSFFDQTVSEIFFNSFIIKEFIYEEISDLSITKTVVYDQNSDTAYYEVKVTSKGQNNNILIEDRATGSALSLNHDTAVVSSIHGNLYPAIDYTSIENGFQFNIFSMANKEVITINFSASVDNNKITGKGKISETINTARVSSDQVPEGREASANFAGLVNFQKISKNQTGVPVPLGDGTYEVTWTIRINQDHKLTLGGQNIYDWVEPVSRAFLWFTGNGISIEVTMDNGMSETRTILWSALDIQMNDKGIFGWAYSAPESDGKASYIITCKGIIDPRTAYGDLTVSNRAVFLSESDTCYITVGDPGIGTIKPSKKVISDTDTITEWEISVSIPKDGLPDFKIVDDLPVLEYSGSVYIDHINTESISVQGLIGNESYTFYLSTSLRSYTLTFYKDQEHQQGGLLPSPDGSDRTITVRFQTTVNQDWLSLAENIGYDRYTAHQNSITARVYDYRVPANAVAIPVRPVIVKNHIESSETVIDGTTFPVFKYEITLLGPTSDNAIIEDRFDTAFLHYYETGGVQILGGNSFSPDDPNGTVSVSDTESGIMITAESFPKDSSGRLYKVYKISYALIVKDKEALNTLNATAAETGEYEFTNYALWQNLISNEVKVCYTYYPYVDKEPIGQPSSENGYIAEFRTVINKYAEDLDPSSDTLTIQDELSQNLRFIPDSITIVPYNGNITVQHDASTNTITFDHVPDQTKFEIVYQARVLGYGEVPYSNTIKFGKYEKIVEDIVIIESSGGGTASNPGITLVKHDSDDLSVLINDVSFQLFYVNDTSTLPVLDKEGENVIFTTDDNGSVLIIGNMNELGWTLWEGRTYCLIETAVPQGYLINTSPACFILSRFPQHQNEYDITGDRINIQNDPERISIPVIKQWIGPALNNVTIHLLADSIDTGKFLELNGNNNWYGVFENLRKYAFDGHEIHYSVKEDPIDFYQSDPVQSEDGSFLVINTNSETISFPVTKYWIGPELSSVTVALKADGTVIDTAVLISEEDWTHIFSPLPKYDPVDGHEIVYSIEEEPVIGYIPEYEGSTINGLFIFNKAWTPTPTNTFTPEPTYTPSPTNTLTPIPTLTMTATAVPSDTPTMIPTSTMTPTATATVLPSDTPTVIPTATVTLTPTYKPKRPPFFEHKEELPKTGLLSDRNPVNNSNQQTQKYTQLRMELDIPVLYKSSEIVTVERMNGEYPVERLGINVGLMADSAIPGQGYSVIVGHNTLNETEYGPFALLSVLEIGDRFFIRSGIDELLIFEIYANEKIGRYDVDTLYSIASQYTSTVTLLTCEDELIGGGYGSRRIIAGRQIN